MEIEHFDIIKEILFNLESLKNVPEALVNKTLSFKQLKSEENKLIFICTSTQTEQA